MDISQFKNGFRQSNGMAISPLLKILFNDRSRRASAIKKALQFFEGQSVRLGKTREDQSQMNNQSAHAPASQSTRALGESIRLFDDNQTSET
jgi:hypothetical protein